MIKIASPVVFKLRVRSANEKDIAEKNKANILYIAWRNGVEKTRILGMVFLVSAIAVTLANLTTLSELQTM